jgi:hypothetical protein
MNTFVQKYAHSITGILSGFDRLVLRGSLRRLAYAQGMKSYLDFSGVLLKNFAPHVEAVTDKIKSAATAVAERHQRPLVYLERPGISKENAAKEIMAQDKVKEGLVCVFTAVEPCRTFVVAGDRETKMLVVKPRTSKCLHVYQYWIDPTFGFMNARLQTWFPFNIQICINGREWLARNLDADHIHYIRRDNCFAAIENVERAQRIMDRQLTVQWPKLLDQVASRLSPAHAKVFQHFDADYYWSAFQSEWATDVMFKNQAALDELYPTLVHHGLTTFQSPDVMRFLGQKLTNTGTVNGNFKGEVTSDMKSRHEGVRIKHRVGGNSIKAYNKQGNILRIETTINDPSGFKVWRPKQDGDQRCREWLPMRKGIADLHRRAEVSQSANDRYLNALTTVTAETSLKDLAASILKPTKINGRRVRALNPLAERDAKLLETVIRGEFTVNGFRNRDLRPFFFSTCDLGSKEARRQSAAMSRMLRMLRAHGLIKKVPRSHRYQVTESGRFVIAAIVSARNASANQLSKLAA